MWLCVPLCVKRGRGPATLVVLSGFEGRGGDSGETWRAAWQRHRWYKDTEARPANGLTPALPDGGAWQQSWSASSDYSESSTSTKCPQSVPLCWTLASDYGRSWPKDDLCHGIKAVIMPCRFSTRTASSQGTDTPAARPQIASGASSSSPMRPSTSGPTSCPPGTIDTFPLVTMAQNFLKWPVFCRSTRPRLCTFAGLLWGRWRHSGAANYVEESQMLHRDQNTGVDFWKENICESSERKETSLLAISSNKPEQTSTQAWRWGSVQKLWF